MLLGFQELFDSVLMIWMISHSANFQIHNARSVVLNGEAALAKGHTTNMPGVNFLAFLIIDNKIKTLPAIVLETEIDSGITKIELGACNRSMTRVRQLRGYQNPISNRKGICVARPLANPPARNRP